MSRRASGTVLGVVIVAPRASEMIFSVALAVEHGLAVDDVAHAVRVCPPLPGSTAETARLPRPGMEKADQGCASVKRVTAGRWALAVKPASTWESSTATE